MKKILTIDITKIDQNLEDKNLIPITSRSLDTRTTFSYDIDNKDDL